MERPEGRCRGCACCDDEGWIADRLRTWICCLYCHGLLALVDTNCWAYHEGEFVLGILLEPISNGLEDLREWNELGVDQSARGSDLPEEMGRGGNEGELVGYGFVGVLEGGYGCALGGSELQECQQCLLQQPQCRERPWWQRCFGSKRFNEGNEGNEGNVWNENTKCLV